MVLGGGRVVWGSKTSVWYYIVLNRTLNELLTLLDDLDTRAAQVA